MTMKSLMLGILVMPIRKERKMGIYKSFNGKKWQWKGAFGVKYYDTETECDADRENVWELHMATLKAWRTVADMLASFR